MLAALGRFVDWIVPPPPPADRESSAEVRLALTRQAAHLLQVATLLTPPTAAMWVAMLWARSDHRGLLLWLLLVHLFTSRVGLLSRRVAALDRPHPALRDRLTWALLTNGIVWGSIALLAMPADPTWHALMGVFIVAPMAVNAIFSAAVARFFWAFQFGLTASALAGFVIAGSGPALAVGAVVLYALPFSGLLARINRATATAASHYAARSQRSANRLRLANDHLAHEANHDSLTGMANRPAFVRRVDQAMSRWKDGRAEGHVGVLFMDLDRFKLVNDSLGHAAGDLVLRAAAARIASRLRNGDLLARLGGDEFTVLVEDVRDAGEVAQVAHRVLEAFAEPFALSGREWDVRVSIGVACTDLDAGLTSSSELLRAADVALYEAKAAGRNVAHTFDAGLRSRIDRHREDERELRRALATGGMTAWFQPIVELRTGRMTAAEALARWATSDGVRSAGSFIDLVSSCGLEAELSLGVAGTVREVRDELLGRGSPLRIGLNVPPGWLPELLDELELEGDLRGVTLEITETGVITDLQGARDKLSQLRSRGAAIWLDDFGQGQSSLSLVAELPLDGIKIDRSFVADMLTSRAARTIVIAIAEIGRCLGLDVIAEGVETPEQVAALSALGVTHAQGFLMSPAVAADDFLAMVDAGTEWPSLMAGSRWVT